jgi:hypothetical protein
MEWRDGSKLCQVEWLMAVGPHKLVTPMRVVAGLDRLDVKRQYSFLSTRNIILLFQWYPWFEVFLVLLLGSFLPVKIIFKQISISLLELYIFIAHCFRIVVYLRVDYYYIIRDLYLFHRLFILILCIQFAFLLRTHLYRSNKIEIIQQKMILTERYFC